MRHLKAELFGKKSFQVSSFVSFFLNLSGDFYIFSRARFVTPLCLFIYFLFKRRDIYIKFNLNAYIYLAICIMNIRVSFYDATFQYIYFYILQTNLNIILFSHFFLNTLIFFFYIR